MTGAPVSLQEDVGASIQPFPIVPTVFMVFAPETALRESSRGPVFIHTKD